MEGKQEISLAKMAQDILNPNSGYLSRLLSRLDKMVKDSEEGKGEKLNLAKAIFLAELVNNELDEYLNEFQGKGIAGLDDYFASEEFKARWLKLKQWRDEIYGRLVRLQKNKGKDAVKEEILEYIDLITRYAS